MPNKQSNKKLNKNNLQYKLNIDIVTNHDYTKENIRITFTFFGHKTQQIEKKYSKTLTPE
jgi:hypothetical protein